MMRTIENKFNLKVGSKISVAGQIQTVSEIDDKGFKVGSGFMAIHRTWKAFSNLLRMPIYDVKFVEEV